MKKSTLGIIIAGLFIAALFFTLGFGLFADSKSIAISASDGETLKIPLSDVSNKARWYEYDFDSAIVKFFAVKAADGSIKTAFDACDVCFRAKKGYRQDGDYMVCNNCGNRYPLSGLGAENKKPGGCWPGYLPSYIDNEYLVIKKSDLDSNKWRF